MIYFDNSATTKIHPAVLDTYVKSSQRIYGNPSSLHDLGDQANRLLYKARTQIAEEIGVLPEEIYFTSGGTEGDNWAIKGTALAKRDFGRHILISSIEHPAVTESAKMLKGLGFEVEEIPVTEKGQVDTCALEKLLRPDTILVSVMGMNNEIGSIQPVQAISQVLMDYPSVHFHVDGVQALGKVPQERWLTKRVDFATFSAHKFHGPKGMGFNYHKKGKLLQPLFHGGGQENKQRSGTENIPGAVSMAKAVRLLLTDEQAKNQHIRKMRDYLWTSLGAFAKVTRFSQIDDSFGPNILCFGIKGVKGEVLVHAFEEKQIYISTTSACSSRKKMSGGTLLSMGISDEAAQTAVRISLDEENTMAEAEQFMIVFRHLEEKFSKINS